MFAGEELYFNIISMASGNGVWVVINKREGGKKQILSSMDSINWTIRVDDGCDWEKVSFKHDLFLAESSQKMMISFNGVNWKDYNGV